MLKQGLADIAGQVRTDGFVFLEAEAMRAVLAPFTAGDWASFADSWNDLGLDLYMADGGRYRRRRFAAFSAADGRITRKPHQPHYQSRDYNLLNGGIERWFEPVTPSVADHPVTTAILRASDQVFESLSARPAGGWHVEMHQFRIEALPGQAGQPTPEGVHRDGVDWVLVLLVNRHNVERGVTTVYGPKRQLLGEFTLTRPLDAVFLDDNRALHGVTAIQPVRADEPGVRDVLVVTFRAEPAVS